MEFEWAPAKAAANLRKHKVSFHEAVTLFADFFSITAPDPDHSGEELRYITVGRSNRERLIMVAHAERRGTIRIISPRKLLEAKIEPMKKTRSKSSDGLRPEYDLRELFRKGVRGKYAKAYRSGTNLVPLDPDVRRAFRDEKAVNDALRLVIQLRKFGRARV